MEIARHGSLRVRGIPFSHCFNRFFTQIVTITPISVGENGCIMGEEWVKKGQFWVKIRGSMGEKGMKMGALS